MGTFIEKYLIVNVWESDWQGKTTEKKIDEYIKKIEEEYRDLFGKFKSVINGYLFYFMAWDGSKEGWGAEEEASKIRAEFINFIKKISPNSTVLYIKEDACDEDIPDYSVSEIDKREWVNQDEIIENKEEQ